MKNMKRALLFLTCAIFATLLSAFQNIPRKPAQAQSQSGEVPRYTTEGQLLFPNHFEKWVHVSSGLGMAYTPPEAGQGDSAPPFTDVLVNPSAYDSFMKTGHWPDKTMMVLEIRQSLSKGSINQAGHYEGPRMGIEVHVKDEARFPGKWGFYGFGADTKPAKLIPTSASCYSCHADHGAVGTTFVQFYPNLLEVATQRGTLDARYVAEAVPLESEMVIDPMCGMKIDAKKTNLVSVYKGKKYYFDQDSCKRAFDAEPEKYVKEGEHQSQ